MRNRLEKYRRDKGKRGTVAGATSRKTQSKTNDDENDNENELEALRQENETLVASLEREGQRSQRLRKKMMELKIQVAKQGLEIDTNTYGCNNGSMDDADNLSDPEVRRVFLLCIMMRCIPM